MSAEYGLYRQDYCGCVFSKKKRTSLRPCKRYPLNRSYLYDILPNRIFIFTYSFLGWVGRSSWRRSAASTGPGVLSGPLCILYGIGGLVITFALGDMSRDGWFFLFVFSAVYATVIEWIGGHILGAPPHPLVGLQRYAVQPGRLHLPGCIGHLGRAGRCAAQVGQPAFAGAVQPDPHGLAAVALWASLVVLGIDLVGTLLAMAGLRYKWPAAAAIETALPT